MYDCRHPICRTPRQPGVHRLSVVVWGSGRLNKQGALGEAVDIDDGAPARCGLAYRGDIDAAPPADQVVGATRTKTVGFDERLIVGPNLEQAPRIGDRPRAVGAAETA
jgi:hypothetical protein